MRFWRAVLLSVSVSLPLPVLAQDAQTLADIRQELTVLNVEIQKLRRELSTTGGATTQIQNGGTLERIGAIETELQRLTSKTERLEYRINRVVTDGTNRIGDLEFRLVELEGGDVSTLGETSTLGGVDEQPVVTPGPTEEPAGEQLAVGEQADFDVAQNALHAGDYQMAADKFGAFEEAYPGSPLGAQAHLLRGKALDGLGDSREAARAYLASFSRDSSGPVAPQALVELGASLGRLGQASQACVTLAEVRVRFPNSAAVPQAEREMASLGCT